MIAKDLQPLSIVENEGFKKFASAMNPSYIIPSRYILTKKLLNSEYEIRVNTLKDVLSQVQSICITTDGWTSVANESYISLTAHFITPNWKMESGFLNCFQTVKSHTADNLKSDILDALIKWGIESKVCCAVSDNAANITAAIKSAGWYNLPCFAHTLHLIVNDGLSEPNINRILCIAKEMVVYFHRSTKASNKLKEMQGQMGKPVMKLINSTPTRWNSVLNMIERLVNNQEVLEATIAILHNPVKMFSADEWNILKELCIILKPFNEITVEMSAENYTTISKIIVLVRGLQSFITKMKTKKNSAEISALLETFLKGISKRFHRVEYNEIMAIPTYLDPRFKSKGFSDANAVKCVKDKISSMYIVQNGSEHSDIPSTKKNQENNNSIWEEFDQTTKVATRTSSCIIELNNYSHEKILDRKNDPIEWWQKHESLYPGLASIAKKYLPIVATSVPSERVFSIAGQVISNRRNLLNSENVEKILFLHFNKN
ncbi:E3 SUMO-protein ligase ZBED1-like [Haematobia irritans]|uniref:E3 SUMO-protein ligase ZBED1-like n=1 Tax=Haematobia irritans TaxID=7368 RepID=UPI003F508ACF